MTRKRESQWCHRIDGGSFRVLRPWMAAGELPNFARLPAEGAVGALGDDPAPRPPAFVSHDGQEPRQANIYDFVRIPRRGVTGAPSSTRPRRATSSEHSQSLRAHVRHRPLSRDLPARANRRFIVGGILTPGGRLPNVPESSPTSSGARSQATASTAAASTFRATSTATSPASSRRPRSTRARGST